MPGTAVTLTCAGHFDPGETAKQITPMTAEDCVNLIEEMIDLKLQRQTETQMKATPEIAGILAEKKMTDARRLKQIRAELIRALSEGEAPTRQLQSV